MICSHCGKDKGTVHREMFDGLCAECTNLSLYDDEISKNAQAKNLELKREGK